MKKALFALLLATAAVVAACGPSNEPAGTSSPDLGLPTPTLGTPGLESPSLESPSLVTPGASDVPSPSAS